MVANYPTSLPAVEEVISRVPKKTPKKRILPIKRRNDALFDIWSLVHLFTGIFMGWVMAPFVALSIMVLWEPLEIFVLSPILGKFGIEFGYETLRNSLSDVFFDVVGVGIGLVVLTSFVDPPFYLF